jgi:hypothetical protein
MPGPHTNLVNATKYPILIHWLRAVNARYMFWELAAHRTVGVGVGAQMLPGTASVVAMGMGADQVNVVEY